LRSISERLSGRTREDCRQWNEREAERSPRKGRKDNKNGWFGPSRGEPARLVATDVSSRHSRR
jgi:hypothetical protein